MDALIAGVVAIIRLREHEPPDGVYEALVAGGVGALEVTMPTPGALETVHRWSRLRRAAVGVGTVRTAEDAGTAIAAGAEFLVTPTTMPGVLDVAAAHGVPLPAAP